MRDQSGSGWRSGVLTFLIALITFGVAWWFTRRETGTVPAWGLSAPPADPEPRASSNPLPTMVDRQSPAAATVTATPEPEPGPYGPDSATALPDGSPPDGFPVKGNTRSMLYHPPDSPNYGRTRAEVWFRTDEAAEAAGFRHWNHRRRKQ